MEKLIIRNVRPPDIEREIIVDYNYNVIRIESSITFYKKRVSREQF